MSEGASATRRVPIRPGELAPDFTLPAVERDGTVSLADYRGRRPLFLALFIGLWCPFCRRAIAQLGTKPAATPKLLEQFASTRVNPTGEFPEPLPIPQAAVAIGQFDGYTNTPEDQAEMDQQWPQLKGQFL
jgi:hypothetical protein